MAPNNNQNRTEPSNTKQVASKKKPSTEFQLRKYLLLLATLVATVTYVAGLNLPGGVWQDTQHDHLAGDPILPDAHHRRYLAFYYCNATAFAASLVVCLLLLVLEEDSTGWAVVLQMVMALDLLGLMGAYAAGSCRDAFTTIYSSVLISGVFTYIVLAFFAYVVSKLHKKQDEDPGDSWRSQPLVGARAECGSLGRADSRQEGELATVLGRRRGCSPVSPGSSPGSPGGEDKREEQHEVLMLLATFAVTITYVAGLNPPGGFWGNTQDGHRVSDPVLQDHYSRRYQAFFVCNTTAFIASLLIIMLLLDKKLKKLERGISVRFVALYGFIIIALFGLVGAYAAGSCREVDNTTYVVCLIGAVLAYIFVQVAITKAINSDKKNCGWCGVLATIYDTASGWLQNKRKSFAGSEIHTKPDLAGSKDTKLSEALEKARDLVMLLATLVASITYQAGLDPPGGLWPDDRDGHKGGDPVLLTTHPTRYKVFFYSNSAAFVASLVVIIMVQSRFLLKRHTLEAAMLLDLFGLIGAYAAGSCRDVSTSIYVVALAGAVLVYVVIHIVFFTLDHRDNHQDAGELDERREVLLLLAILAATLTYQAGLTPPGGFWSADDKFGHHAGFPVLLDNYPRRYKAFFYCNGTSFMASVALIVLLVNPNLYRPGIRCYALYVCMVAGMFGLMGAYAAGSSRHLRTSIYVLILVVAVFVSVVWLGALFFTRKDDDGDKSDDRRKRDGGYETDTPPRKSDDGDETDTPKKPSADGDKSATPNKESSEDMPKYLMLLGILAASVAYLTGLKPPGGTWKDDGNGHSAGGPILYDINKRRYNAFFYTNSTAFMASIVVIVLLLRRMLYSPRDPPVPVPLWPMHTAILLGVTGLLGAYAVGSARDWGTSWNVMALLVPMLAFIAFCVAVQLYSSARKKNPSSGGNSQKSHDTQQHGPESGASNAPSV